MVSEQVSVVVIDVDANSDRLKAAIESVVNQTHQASELILVGDQLESKQHLLSLHPNIKLVKPVCDNVASAFNSAIGSSTSEYIAFLDGNDIWPSNKLSEQIAVIKRNPDVGLCYTEFEEVGATPMSNKNIYAYRLEVVFEIHTETSGDTTTWVYRPKTSDRDLAALFFVELECIPISTVMITRECIPYTGLFDPMLEHASPCDMWIKILRRFAAAKVSCRVNCNLRKAKLSLNQSSFDHNEIYSKYVQFGVASDNRELVAYATTLLAKSSHHIASCHQLS